MTVTQQAWISELQSIVTNPLDPRVLSGKRVAGIFGDAPSTYAKSPSLWNAAFQALGLEAIFIPLDIPQGKLKDAVHVLREAEDFLGGSVTVPYKSEIIPFLDSVDPLTKRIGAVNVVVRSREGKLIGYNTDGLGGVCALTDAVLPGSQPLLKDLTAARILMIGAGGAAQAVAFNLWDRMRKGRLLIANRSQAAAGDLAKRLSGLRHGPVEAISESDILDRIGEVDLVLNASTKGQAGIRKLAQGWTSLEPYSALGPADPAVIKPTADGFEAAFQDTWFRRSIEDIARNHEASLKALAALPKTAACYDIVYAPQETVFLRQARWAGRATLNGKAMNVVQAVEAFMTYVCKEWMREQGKDTPEVYRQVAQAMAEQWAR